MTRPLLDATTATPAALLQALRRHGALLWRDPRLPRRSHEHALAAIARMTRWPDAEKQRLAVERSPHFRGYSRMHNERDFREQLHLGRERAPATAAATTPFWRLQGPNAQPGDERFVRDLRDWHRRVGRVACDLLRRLATALELPGAAAGWLGRDPYLLAKCIAYHAQPDDHDRPGVAAHVDFSLLTITLQDDTGGLEVQDPLGRWCPAAPRPGTVVVHVGELLQFVTGNLLSATPHRVHNPSRRRQRCSLPLFVNPSLDTTLRRQLPLLAPAPEGADHVHRVLAPREPAATLAFGPAEWRRKGENRWCAQCTGAPTAEIARPAAT
ncbi:MAG: isopenicillin N synthase family oxygenase [Planctomycetes bacterium]|nr:isopenicillin N synthase family oxygenase [Planctomycetota bacterium]